VDGLFLRTSRHAPEAMIQPKQRSITFRLRYCWLPDLRFTFRVEFGRRHAWACRAGRQ
jgi:hypothetical protein